MKKLFYLSIIFCYLKATAQHKRIYIASDDHTDYMWTANEAKYDSAFVQMLDYYLLQIDSTSNSKPDYQARFNCDGTIWLKSYQKFRSPQQFDKLVRAIRSGHISSPLNILVSCYGAQPTEAVLRGMYYAGQLERQYNLRFTLASSMENNTLPLGLASLWAGSGARYSWKGIGGYGSQMSYPMRAKRRYPMYRYTGLDGSSVLMKWYAYNEQKTGWLGGYAECRLAMKYKDAEKDLREVVNILDTLCDAAQTNYPYLVAGAFGFGHDDLETYLSPTFIEAARNSTDQTRSVRVSNQEDFFRDFEKTYPKLPAQSVSFGNEWDLLPASMNETTARVRRSTEKLRAAEALASIVSLTDKSFASDLMNARNEAWDSYGLYWEHNWTADGPVSRKDRAIWQVKRQQMLSNYVDTLFNRSVLELGRHLALSASPSFYVFNPLSWTRSDIADLVYEGTYPVNVTDRTTGKKAVTQLILKEGQKMLRIWAEDIPSTGYKVFEIREGASVKAPMAAAFSNEYFSNSFYRLRMNKAGAITELYDKKAKRQLVKAEDGKYVNDLGGKSEGEELSMENAGPVSVTLKAVSGQPILHTTRVTLYAESHRIDIEDSIQANFGDVKTWSFSFNLNNPTTRHEELGAILTAKKVSRGGNYADENARYDWQTFNHFAAISEKDYGITLSNRDCSFFKLGKSSLDSLWDQSAQLHALAGGNIDKKVEDGGVLGILNQDDQKDFCYQFSIIPRSGPFAEIEAMKASLEHQNPLVAAMVTGRKGATLRSQYSLLTISDPKVLLWSLKPAEEGIKNGLITRFWNMGNAASKPTIRLAMPIIKGWKTSHIETNETMLRPSGGRLQTDFRAHQISTYRLVTEYGKH